MTKKEPKATRQNTSTDDIEVLSVIKRKKIVVTKAQAARLKINDVDAHNRPCVRIIKTAPQKSEIRQPTIVQVPVSQPSQLKSHDVNCLICNTIFQNLTMLETHYDMTHPEKKILCSTCGVGIYKQLQSIHDRTHKNIITTKFECHICKASFSRGENLKLHYKSCHSDKNNVTPCDDASPIQQQLEVDEIPPVESYGCGSCDQIFGSIDLLRRHSENSHPQDDIS